MRRTLLEVLKRISLVLEWPAGQSRQLSVMAIIEDGKVLTVGCEIRNQARTAEGVDDGTGCKGRSALFATESSVSPVCAILWT